MSLRIDKILEKVRIKVLSYLVSENNDLYLEVASISHGEHFIISVPRSINNLKTDYQITYNLRKIDTDKKDEKAEVSELYPEISLNNNNLDFPLNNEELEDNLLTAYKRKLNLNKNNEQETDISDTVKQIKRLSLFVKEIPYKVGIIYEDHFFTIDSENKPLCFFIKEKICKNNRHKFYVTVPLEILVEKIEKNRITDIFKDIKQILTDTKKLLDNNQYSHIEKLSLLFEKKETVIDIIQSILDKRKFYKDQQVELNSLINNCLLKEEILKEEIDNLRKHSYSTKVIANNDLNMAYKREAKESEYRENINLKYELIEKLNKVKEKENNIVLFTDKILFDNILSLNKVLKNLEIIDKLI